MAEETGVKPHEHQGLLQSYDAAPPDHQLTDEDLQRLDNYQAVFYQEKLEHGHRGVVIFRVDASQKNVWSVIKDFPSYPGWIDTVDEIEVYQQQPGQTAVKFLSGGLLGGKTIWHVIHDYPVQDREWGTWKLDYSRQSDIYDTVGYWRVMTNNANADVSYVIYSVDLDLKGFFSSLLEASLIKDSINDATQWVKVQAEDIQQSIQ